MLLAGVASFILLVGYSKELQQTLPFLVSLCAAAIFWLLVLAVTLNQNPVHWIVNFICQLQSRVNNIYFIVHFVSSKFLISEYLQVYLIVYWMFCSTSAVLIAWSLAGADRGDAHLTILRKYFHGVVIAVYVPGVWLGAELLLLATAVALAAFLLVEVLTTATSATLEYNIN